MRARRRDQRSSGVEGSLSLLVDGEMRATAARVEGAHRLTVVAAEEVPVPMRLAGAFPARWPRQARSSDTRCSGAGPGRRERGRPASGTRRGSACTTRIGPRTARGSLGSSSSVVTTSPRSSIEPSPGTMSRPFLPTKPRPARTAHARSRTGSSSQRGLRTWAVPGRSRSVSGGNVCKLGAALQQEAVVVAAASVSGNAGQHVAVGRAVARFVGIPASYTHDTFCPHQNSIAVEALAERAVSREPRYNVSVEAVADEGQVCGNGPLNWKGGDIGIGATPHRFRPSAPASART